MKRNTLQIASLLIIVGLSGIWPLAVCMAQENVVQEGRDLLLDYAFLPRDFHQSTFDELWKDWPEPLRSQAEQASAAERRKMALIDLDSVDDRMLPRNRSSMSSTMRDGGR